MRKEQGKRVACHKLQTKQEENQIKQMSLTKNGTNLLLHIREVDLIAKEFQSSYRDYIREANKDDWNCSGECSKFSFDAVNTLYKKMLSILAMLVIKNIGGN